MSDPIPRLNDVDFSALTAHIQSLLESLESLPYPKVQEQTFELLNCMDMLHREALTRLLDLINAKAPSLVPELEKDFAVQTLLMLYNFVPEAPTAATEPSNAAGMAAPFIALDDIQTMSIKMPIWIPGGRISELAPGTMKAKIFDGEHVLLCRVADEIFALHNACLDSILPLQPGKMEGYILTCPWHNCQYDVRTGEIQNGSRLTIETYPVKTGEDGRFTVGFNIPTYSHW